MSAVLNLQTKDDFERHQIDWKRTLKIFYHNGIVLAKNFPVNDLHEEIYSSDIIQAAQYLNDMINNKNLNVYIYCSSGISRAPTVILAYLTLFKKAQCWQYIPLVESLIISHYPCCSPNVKIVQGLVEQNLEFQKEQVQDERNILAKNEMNVQTPRYGDRNNDHESMKKKIFEE